MKDLKISIWQIIAASVLVVLYVHAGPNPQANFLISGDAVELTPCVLPVAGEGSLSAGDVANGRYPHLRKVGIEDPEFKDVMSWLLSNGAPCPTRVYVAKGLGLPGDNLSLPAELHWTNTKQGDDPLKLDAALVFNFPHVALVELENAYHFGNPNAVKMYSGPRMPVQFVDASPIGEYWPDKCDKCYRPSAADHFPYGAIFEDPTGKYVREKRGWAFVSYPVWVRQ